MRCATVFTNIWSSNIIWTFSTLFFLCSLPLHLFPINGILAITISTGVRDEQKRKGREKRGRRGGGGRQPLVRGTNLGTGGGWYIADPHLGPQPPLKKSDEERSFSFFRFRIIRAPFFMIIFEDKQLWPKTKYQRSRGRVQIKLPERNRFIKYRRWGGIVQHPPKKMQPL